MKHYDIGVVGWWHNSNYGSILTYYALHQTLKKMGYSVLMIHEALGLNGRAKWNTSNAPHVFARKHYEFDEQVPYSELQKYNEVCDTFIAGSDQLWNPYIPRVNSDCFLDFTTDDKKRIAYATSFGDEGVLGTRPKFIEKNRDLLRRFHAVSVREEYAVKLAERFFGVRAVRVTDPVFLPDMEEYTKLADNATDKIEGEYLLAFILDPTEQKKQVIKRIAEKLGYTKVFVLTDPYQSRVELADKVFAEPLFSKYELKQISPENFLSAYRNASYVITDSFHGTCFSYLFRKNFNVFYNIQRGAGRFVSVLSTMKLEHRRVYEDSRTEPDLSPVNFTEAEKNIGELRDFSLSWLKNALETPVDRIPSILISGSQPEREKKGAMKATVSVLGCCVSRDIFRIIYPDKYNIERTFGAFSPISMQLPKNENSPTISMNDLDGVELPGYFKRCFLSDYNKTGLSYLSDVQSDWLVLDVAHARFDLATFEYYPKSVVSYFPQYKNSNLSKKFGEMRLYKHPWDFADDEIYSFMNSYLDQILKLYPQEKIIFLDIYCVGEYISKAGSISKFSNCDTYGPLNTIIKKCSDIVRFRLPNCHWISFPNNVIANENHTWGKLNLHYDTLYYEYAAKAFDLINEKKSQEQEKKGLDALCSEYSERFTALRLYHLNITLDMLRKTQRFYENACDFCVALCIDYQADRKFDRFMQSLSGKSVALLKSQDKAGIVFQNSAKSCGVKIVFQSVPKPTLTQLTPDEFAACKKADMVITCCVHGTKTHERDGVKCIDIWDILRDDSLTKDLPASGEEEEKA